VHRGWYIPQLGENDFKEHFLMLFHGVICHLICLVVLCGSDSPDGFVCDVQVGQPSIWYREMGWTDGFQLIQATFPWSYEIGR
jgi:hypothetical protein